MVEGQISLWGPRSPGPAEPSPSVAPRGDQFMSLYRSLFVTLLLATAPIAASAAPADFAGLVDIGGGRKMYLEGRGAGVPAVVIVAGRKASPRPLAIAPPCAAPRFSRLSPASPAFPP